MKSAINEEEYKIASHTFMQVKEYADAFVLAEQCVQSAEIARKDAIYEEACKGLHSENIRILKNSIGLFEKIPINERNGLLKL